MAGVDALQAWSEDRRADSTRSGLRRAWGPRPGLALGVLSGLVAVATVAWIGPAPTVYGIRLPSAGGVVFALIAIWRVRAASTVAGATPARGVRIALVPALLVLGLGEGIAGGTLPAAVPLGAWIGLDASQHLADALPHLTRPVLAACHQLAWVAGLVLAGTHPRWVRATAGLLALGAATTGAVHGGWALSAIGDEVVQTFVLSRIGAFLDPYVALVRELADVGFALGAWSWMAAVAWLWLAPGSGPGPAVGSAGREPLRRGRRQREMGPGRPRMWADVRVSTMRCDPTGGVPNGSLGVGLR